MLINIIHYHRFLVLYIASYLILSTSVWDRYYHYPHLTDEETKVKLLAKDHRVSGMSSTNWATLTTPSSYFYALDRFAIVASMISSLKNPVRWAAGIFSSVCRWGDQGLLSNIPNVKILVNGLTRILLLIQCCSHSVDSFLLYIRSKIFSLIIQLI